MSCSQLQRRSWSFSRPTSRTLWFAGMHSRAGRNIAATARRRSPPDRGLDGQGRTFMCRDTFGAKPPSHPACHCHRMTQLAKEAGPSLPDHVRLLLDTIISDLSQAAGACDRILGGRACMVLSSSWPGVIRCRQATNLSSFGRVRWITPVKIETYTAPCDCTCIPSVLAPRSSGTPIPLSYTRHTSRSLMLWLSTLPFALWPACGWLTVPATIVLSYVFVGIDEIGVEVSVI